MGLKDIGAKLPPGFRFHPSDEELVCHYLRNKIRAKFNHDDDEHDDHHHHHHHDHDAKANLKVANTDLVEIDLHTCEPWQLPDVAKLNAKEWYFFSFRDRKYATGYRTNRATKSGYWKATGKDRMVVDPRTRQMVGMRKTLVFYRNRAPNGLKTTWIMHEFRLECPNMPPKEDWVLCRVFNKSKDNESLRFVNSPPNLNHTHVPSSPLQDNHHHHHHHQHHHQIPCGWEQIIGHHRPSSSSSPPSSTIDHSHHHNDHYHHHHHHDDQTMKTPCGWEHIMGSSHGPHQAHESLLNLLYDNGVITECCEHEDNYKNMFSDMGLEKTCVGSSSSDGLVSDIHLEHDELRFEIDTTTVDFQ